VVYEPRHTWPPLAAVMRQSDIRDTECHLGLRDPVAAELADDDARYRGFCLPAD